MHFSRHGSACWSLFLGITLLFLVELLCANTTSFSAPDLMIWKGPLLDNQVVWTTNDIQIQALSPPHTVRYSLRKKTLDDFHEWVSQAEEGNSGSDEKYRYTFEQTETLLSAVGPYISLREEQYISSNMQAHPSMVTLFKTINITHPEQKLSLNQLFPDKVILEALLHDKWIQKAIEAHNLPKHYTSTQDLFKNFMNDVTPLNTGNGECDDYMLSDDVLEHFAFHHIQNNKVAVRISLMYSSEVCRGNYTQLGILLPIPGKLKPALLQAQSKKQGFLMVDSAKFAKNKNTTIVLTNESQ